MRDQRFWENQRLAFLTRAAELRRDLHGATEEQAQTIHADLATIRDHCERLVEQRDRCL